MKPAGIVIPPPPLLCDDEDDDNDDNGNAAAIKALSSVEHECPICKSKLHVGKSKEKGKPYVMCSSGGCTLGWQNGEYLMAIKFNCLPEFKYPSPKVRCKEHNKLAILIMATSANEILKGQLIFTCGVREKKEKNVDLLNLLSFHPVL